MSELAKSTGMRVRLAPKRKHEPEVDFRIVVAPIGTFQTLVSTVHCLLSDVHFFVIKNDTFEGIKVDSSTLDNTTMLKQQLSCNVELPEGVEEINFCVNVQQLNSRIKNGNAAAFEIVRYKEQGHQIHIFYPNSNPRREFTLRTLTKDVVDNRLFDIDTQISIQIRLSEIKEISRDFAKYGASYLKVTVESAAENDTNHSFFTLSSEADGNVSKVTYHSTYRKTANNDIQVMCDEQSMLDYEGAKNQSKQMYSDSFPLDTINAFLKSIDKGFVWLALSQRGPMILQYGLGNENSNMRLILAPCAVDSDDEL
jgi:hypothetical protein